MLEHHNATASAPARVVLLGKNGFVGQVLAKHLAATGVPTVAFGRDEIDLTADHATEKLAKELRPDDVVVFLAALTPDKGRGVPPFLANLKMAAAVCAAFEQAVPAHVIYISSDAVYPFRTGLINETSAAEPTDLYGAMHISREIMTRQAAKVPVAVLRPTLIYGADDTHNSYGPNRLRRMARKEGRITLFGEGEETRDHIFIDDVVKLIDLVIRHRSAGLLNLATGRSTTFADLARLVAQHFGSAEIVGTPRQNPVTHRAFDVTAVYQSFPAFNFTPLEKGLAAAHRGDV